MPSAAIPADRFSAELHKVLPGGAGGLRDSAVNLTAGCRGTDLGQQAGWGGAAGVSFAAHLSWVPQAGHSSLWHAARLSELIFSLEKLILLL